MDSPRKSARRRAVVVEVDLRSPYSSRALLSVHDSEMSDSSSLSSRSLPSVCGGGKEGERGAHWRLSQQLLVVQNFLPPSAASDTICWPRFRGRCIFGACTERGEGAGERVGGGCHTSSMSSHLLATLHCTIALLQTCPVQKELEHFRLRTRPQVLGKKHQFSVHPVAA